jgi:hypothetical protein
MVLPIVATPTPRDHDLNKLESRKLSCKYELFSLCGSGEENFLNAPTPFLYFYDISPLKRTWPFD